MALGLGESTQRLVECFGWCHPAEGVSRSVVELGGDGAAVGLGVSMQVGALGKYWRNRPLVCSLVPRCQGSGGRGSGRDAGVDAEPRVLGHLCALIPGDRPSELSGRVVILMIDHVG
jgi:hypothetical protein